jgi:hypothetical protein
VADSEPFVATVAGRRISVEHLRQRVADLRRGPRGRHMPPGDGPESLNTQRWVVQELVTEQVLAHEAQAAGLENADQLVEHVTADVAVDEDDIRAYYERNADLFLRPEIRRITHFVVRDRTAAQSLATRLAGAESWATGGERLDVRRGEHTGPLEDALFAAEEGTLVGPVETEHGFHVARIESVIPQSVAPYEEVRTVIEEELLVAARNRAFDEWLDGRRQELATIEPQFEHPAHPIHGIPSHRH